MIKYILSFFQRNNFNFVAEYTFFLVSWTSRKILMYLLLRRSLSFFIETKRRLEHHNCKTLNIRENISFKCNLFIFNLQSHWSQTKCSQYFVTDHQMIKHDTENVLEHSKGSFYQWQQRYSIVDQNNTKNSSLSQCSVNISFSPLIPGGPPSRKRSSELEQIKSSTPSCFSRTRVDFTSLERRRFAFIILAGLIF